MAINERTNVAGAGEEDRRANLIALRRTEAGNPGNHTGGIRTEAQQFTHDAAVFQRNQDFLDAGIAGCHRLSYSSMSR